MSTLYSSNLNHKQVPEYEFYVHRRMPCGLSFHFHQTDETINYRDVPTNLLSQGNQVIDTLQNYFDEIRLSL